MIDVPTLPIDEPVLIFTLAVAVFLIGPLLIRRLGQPGIVGIVLFGAIIGPGGLELVEHGDAIVLLGNVGLIYLLFTVGLELDLRGFARAPGSAATFGLVSFGLPFLVGTTAGVMVLGLDRWAAALLAAVFASHTLLAYPIVNQYNVTQNRAVTAVFGGILFTDTLALIVLALVMGGAIGDGLTVALVFQVFLSLAVLFAGVWLVVPPIARWFFQNFSEESYFEFLFVVVAFYAAASLAEVLDIAPILGAFVAGLALNRSIPEGGTLMNRIEFVGNALFIPFFLLHVGMLVDFGVIFEGWRTLQIATLIIGVMVGTKWIATQVVGTIQDYDADERGVVFGLSVGQAAAALAITLIGYEAGLFTAAILNAVVVMLLVTAILSPWLTERASRRLALTAEVAPSEDTVMDPRIILPLSHNAELQRRLLELSFILKGDTPDEPVHVLTVVQPGTDTDERVSEVRGELEGLIEIGNAAEVPVDTETRVNYNVASAITQGATEVQADAIVMGWDATRSLSHRIFGSIIDRVLDRTTLPVLISRLGHPINTTDRIFVVVPSGIDHHEGFFESVHLVKRLADRLGAPLTALVIDEEPRPYEALFELVEPEATVTFERVETWDELMPTLEEASGPNDLVTVLSSREGEIGWHPAFRELPTRLAALPPRSFIMLHLREEDPEYDRKFLRFR